MVTALFFYNIIIMSAYIFNCVCFYTLYKKKKTSIFLYIAFIFLLFILDNLQVYMCEFLPGFSRYYEFHVRIKGYISNIIGYLILFTYRLIMVTADGKSLKKAERIFWGILLILYLAITFYYPNYYAQFLIIALRHGFSILVFAVSYLERIVVIKEKNGISLGQDNPNQILGTKFIFISMVFQIFETMVDYLYDFDIYILVENRNILTELIGVYYTIFGLIFIINNLFTEKDKPETPNPVKPVPDIHKFCKKYIFTRREEEVFHLLIKGHSNSEIANILIISEGTVKTHVHNIYQKLNVNNRLQLINLFEGYIKMDD